jgi:hypothetical protein
MYHPSTYFNLYRKGSGRLQVVVNSGSADFEFLRGYGVCESFSSTVTKYSTPHHPLQIVVMFRKAHANTAHEAGILETESCEITLKL